MRPFAFGALLACALVALAGPARAQQPTPTTPAYVEKKTDDGQDIRFPDDPLSAPDWATIGSQFTGFHPPRRFDLMRPRKTWVPELLKSVENM